MSFTGNALRFGNGGQSRYSIAAGMPSVFPFTVCFWLYSENGNGGTYFFRGNGSTWWYFGESYGGVTYAEIYLNSQTRFNDTHVPAGQWRHYALVIESATSLKVYRDGALIGSMFGATIATLPDGLYLGDWSGTGAPMNGRLAAVKMWSAALDASEVAAEKDFYAPQRDTDLYGWWYDSVTDESGNGHNWTDDGAVPVTVTTGPTLADYDLSGFTGSGSATATAAVTGAGTLRFTGTATGAAFAAAAGLATVTNPTTDTNVTAEEIVYSVLAGGSTAALVPPSRIKVPGDWQNLAAPYIMHHPAAPEDTIHTHDGGLQRLRIWPFYQISVFAETLSSARSIARAIVADLDGYRDRNVQTVWYEGTVVVGQSYDTDHKLQHLALTFRIGGTLV